MEEYQWDVITNVTKEWFASPPYRFLIETRITSNHDKARFIFLLEDRRSKKGYNLPIDSDKDSLLEWNTITELTSPVTIGTLTNIDYATNFLRDITKDFITLLPDEYIAAKVRKAMYETLTQLDEYVW